MSSSTLWKFNQLEWQLRRTLPLPTKAFRLFGKLPDKMGDLAGARPLPARASVLLGPRGDANDPAFPDSPQHQLAETFLVQFQDHQIPK